jgi:hypothetical protein
MMRKLEDDSYAEPMKFSEHLMVKCRDRHTCGWVARFDFHVTGQRIIREGRRGPAIERQLTAKLSDGRTVNFHSSQVLLREVFPKCGRCHMGVYAEPIQGVYSSTECGPKCWNSIGGKCKCACSGTNHGKAYAA